MIRARSFGNVTSALQPWNRATANCEPASLILLGLFHGLQAQLFGWHLYLVQEYCNGDTLLKEIEQRW